jgi:uncharacterized membrane protein YdbT with pleckstrin-like domain
MEINALDNDQMACPMCAEIIKKTALKCKHCNSDLQTLVVTHDAEIEKTIFNGHPATIYSAWQWVSVVLTLGLAYLYFLAKRMGVRYEITSQRIKIECGVLSTDKNSVELFTIEHFDIQKPLGMRLMGFCVLQMQSSDVNYQVLNLYGIPGLEQMADTLRECALRERARRRVMPIFQT